MDIWQFLVAVVAIEAFVKIVRLKVASREARVAMTSQNAALGERMEKLERRMANLETIVLEAEKKKEFDRAL